MIDKELIKSIISEGYEYIPQVDIVPRNVTLEPVGNYVFVGVRQAGKSYTLYQQMQQKLDEGVPLENLVYINFDDERLHGMTADQLDLILQANYSVRNLKPIFSLTRYRMWKGGRTLPVGLPIKNIRYILRAAMPRC